MRPERIIYTEPQVTQQWSLHQWCPTCALELGVGQALPLAVVTMLWFWGIGHRSHIAQGFKTSVATDNYERWVLRSPTSPEVWTLKCHGAGIWTFAAAQVSQSKFLWLRLKVFQTILRLLFWMECMLSHPLYHLETHSAPQLNLTYFHTQIKSFITQIIVRTYSRDYHQYPSTIQDIHCNNGHQRGFQLHWDRLMISNGFSDT